MIGTVRLSLFQHCDATCKLVASQYGLLPVPTHTHTHLHMYTHYALSQHAVTQASSEGDSAAPVKPVIGLSAPVKHQELSAAELFTPREVIQ